MQPEALEDALRQLFILDAIDGQGEVTPLGSQMARLPLDPCLARMLIAAANLGCLPEALIVAAMLSADSIFAENRQVPSYQLLNRVGQYMATSSYAYVKFPI